MKSIHVIYGSTTGNTQQVAETIAQALGTQAINISDATDQDWQADILLLGSSTWGFGDLQDDWQSGIFTLQAQDLSKCQVAVFGTGDQSGFSTTYANALSTLAHAAQDQGATLIGQTAKEGYIYDESEAEQEGVLCGLALDPDNQPELTESRIATWIKEIQAAAQA